MEENVWQCSGVTMYEVGRQCVFKCCDGSELEGESVGVCLCCISCKRKTDASVRMSVYMVHG